MKTVEHGTDIWIVAESLHTPVLSCKIYDDQVVYLDYEKAEKEYNERKAKGEWPQILALKLSI